MAFLTFKGGIHPSYKKEYSNNKSIEKSKSPEIVYIPLQQHIGSPAKSIVNVGDKVKLGQLIGEQQGFVSCNVHSSVSGSVLAIETREVAGGSSQCIVVKNDFEEEMHESVKPKGDLDNLSSEELVQIIKEAGIVGMGGATFPSYVKVLPPSDKKIDVVILNGAECEPYLTADHRLMVESPDDVVFGLKALMKSLNVNKGFIGIEVNKPDAIDAIQNAVKNEKNIEVVSLEIKYPQGAEKQLIYACTKKEVPSGGLPMDVGAVVNNVGTAAQIATTIKTGMPLVERITTVTGSCINEPKNLIVKVGTLVSEIIDQCGGIKDTEKLGKIIMGGPMMGNAQYTINIPANKGTSGILCLNEKDSKAPKVQNCIRCGKCVDVCPAFLQPLYISAHSLRSNFEVANEYNALDCIECGSCSFICPARRHLLQSIRNAKKEILELKRKEEINK